MKYKLKTVKGQKVYRVDVGIRDSPNIYDRTTYHRHGIFVKELKIVHQTEFKIALSDEWITLLDRQKGGEKKDKYKSFIGDYNVSIVTNETYLPNGVFCTCYTLESPDKSINKIKKAIMNKINKDYGFLRDANLGSVLDRFEINTL